MLYSKEKNVTKLKLQMLMHFIDDLHKPSNKEVHKINYVSHVTNILSEPGDKLKLKIE